MNNTDIKKRIILCQKAKKECANNKRATKKAAFMQKLFEAFANKTAFYNLKV